MMKKPMAKKAMPKMKSNGMVKKYNEGGAANKKRKPAPKPTPNNPFVRINPPAPKPAPKLPKLDVSSPPDYKKPAPKPSFPGLPSSPGLPKYDEGGANKKRKPIPPIYLKPLPARPITLPPRPEPEKIITREMLMPPKMNRKNSPLRDGTYRKGGKATMKKTRKCC